MEEAGERKGWCCEEACEVWKVEVLIVMDSGACGDEAADDDADDCAGVTLHVNEDSDDGFNGVVGMAPVPLTGACGDSDLPLLLLLSRALLSSVCFSSVSPTSYSCKLSVGGGKESSAGSEV